MNHLSLIEELKAFDLRRSNYDDVVSTILKLGDVAVFQITIPRGSYILRNRSEFVTTQKHPFIHCSQLGIRADVERIIPNRCNWYKQPVFYGVVPMSTEESDGDKAQYLALMESSKIADENNKCDYVQEEFATTSKWRVSEDIRCSAMITNETFASNSAGVNYFLQRYNEYIKAHGERAGVFKAISNYFDKEFGKPVPRGEEHEYAITSALSHIHLNGFGFDAMIYPSVKVKGQGDGLNVALNRSALHKIHLEVAVMKHVYYLGTTSKVFPDIHMICKSVNRDGTLNWTRHNAKFARDVVLRELNRTRT